MCNNRLINKLHTPQGKSIKNQISNWLEERPELIENQLAKVFSIENEDCIEYSEKNPLKLHNGTSVLKIYSELIDEGYKKVYVEFIPNDECEKVKTSIKRFSNDKLKDVEQFIENSKSICQLVNIDLDWS